MVKVSRQGHFWSRACIGSSFDLAVKNGKYIGGGKEARIFQGGGHIVSHPQGAYQIDMLTSMLWLKEKLFLR